jgi:hypothetical protein
MTTAATSEVHSGWGGLKNGGQTTKCLQETRPCSVPSAQVRVSPPYAFFFSFFLQSWGLNARPHAC